MSGVFSDSKTFVDLKMKNEESVVLKNFGALMVGTNNTPTQREVRRFVDKNFEEGAELEKWVPADYSPNPRFLEEIDDEVVKNFAGKIVRRWSLLARKVKKDVMENSSRWVHYLK